MAHKRKDTFTAPKEWAKHLRPFGKRQQAKAERRSNKINTMKDLVCFLDCVEKAAVSPWPKDFYDC